MVTGVLQSRADVQHRSLPRFVNWSPCESWPALVGDMRPDAGMSIPLCVVFVPPEASASRRGLHGTARGKPSGRRGLSLRSIRSRSRQRTAFRSIWPSGWRPRTIPVGSVKRFLGELGEYWRYRVGPYRVLATIEDDALRILVVRVAHRNTVYRQ
jgi:hypothetical protein